MDAAGKASIHSCIQVFAASGCFSTYTFQSFFFITVMSDLKTRSMNNEMEKNHGDTAPHPMDAEKIPSCNGATETHETECTELEERVRADCRRTCRRNFWIELFKSAAKIAGVVLAALGLSSFNEES